MKRRYQRTRPAARRARFISPGGQPPERWRLIKIASGRYVPVDSDGIRVLEHWDPVVRRYNLHRVKATPVREFALAHAYRFIYQLESARPFSDWILQLITDAMAEGVPHIAVGTQPEQEEKTLEAA